MLREVVKQGSFSGAAESLDYTQSAISQAIARLEGEAGAQLVLRDRGGIRPTAAGATLVEHADTILTTIQTAEEELANVLGVRSGRLRLASFPSAGSTLIPRAVAMFRRDHPDVTLTLAEGEPEQIAPRIRAGEFDLALLFEFPGTGGRLREGLRSVTLLEDPMFVALPADHRLARKGALRLADLHGEDWVQTSSDSPCACHVVRLCLAAGFEPRVTFESDDYETVQGLVAAGVGVALIPRLALSHVNPRVVVRSLSPRTPSRKIIAVTPPGGASAPSALRMLGILADVAGGQAAAEAEKRAGG